MASSSCRPSRDVFPPLRESEEKGLVAKGESGGKVLGGLQLLKKRNISLTQKKEVGYRWGRGGYVTGKKLLHVTVPRPHARVKKKEGTRA